VVRRKTPQQNDDAIGPRYELGRYGVGFHDHPGDASQAGAVEGNVEVFVVPYGCLCVDDFFLSMT
jgi:hypothetical protein